MVLVKERSSGRYALFLISSYQVCMNNMSPDYYRDETANESIENTHASIDYIRKIDPEFSLVCPIITPRFAPSCTSELLTRLGELAKESNLPIQTHMSENLAEVALVKNCFRGTIHTLTSTMLMVSSPIAQSSLTASTYLMMKLNYVLKEDPVSLIVQSVILVLRLEKQKFVG